MTGRQSVPLCLEREEAVDVGTGMHECKTPERTLSTHSNRRRPGDTEQRRETKRGAGRARRDHHGVLAMLDTATRAQKGKREHREAKRGRE